MSSLRRPIDGDAALPVVHWTHHDLTLPGLREIETTVVKDCRCSATVDYSLFCCVRGLLCVIGILVVSLQLCPASQSVVSAVIQSINLFLHIVVEYSCFPLFSSNEWTTITQVIYRHVEAIRMNCQEEGLYLYP